MDDFISREAALACFSDWIDRYGHEHTADEMVEYQRIEELPVADAVEVVRCKECKYWCSTLTYIDLLEARHDPYTDGVCDLYDCDGFQPNDFCSKAVRRDNYGADMREPNLDTTKGERRDESNG